MAQLAERGRGAFPQIRPVADTNTGPREGWAAMPVIAGEPAPRAQVVEEAPAPVDVAPAADAVPPTEPGLPE
jgi:hypothetical protein